MSDRRDDGAAAEAREGAKDGTEDDDDMLCAILLHPNGGGDVQRIPWYSPSWTELCFSRDALDISKKYGRMELRALSLRADSSEFHPMLYYYGAEAAEWIWENYPEARNKHLMNFASCIQIVPNFLAGSAIVVGMDGCQERSLTDREIAWVLERAKWSSVQDTCDACGQPARSLKRCSRCKARKYCGQKCQANAWKHGSHNIRCGQ